MPGAAGSREPAGTGPGAGVVRVAGVGRRRRSSRTGDHLRGRRACRFSPENAVCTNTWAKPTASGTEYIRAPRLAEEGDPLLSSRGPAIAGGCPDPVHAVRGGCARVMRARRTPSESMAASASSGGRLTSSGMRGLDRRRGCVAARPDAQPGADARCRAVPSTSSPYFCAAAMQTRAPGPRGLGHQLGSSARAGPRDPRSAAARLYHVPADLVTGRTLLHLEHPARRDPRPRDRAGSNQKSAGRTGLADRAARCSSAVNVGRSKVSVSLRCSPVEIGRLVLGGLSKAPSTSYRLRCGHAAHSPCGRRRSRPAPACRGNITAAANSAWRRRATFCARARP